MSIKNVDKRYVSLKCVLTQAYDEASIGKGHERHATEANFEDQQLCQDLRAFGVSPALYQIRKKALEVDRLNYHHQKNELLGIIIYAAAAVIELEREEQNVLSNNNNEG